MEKPIDASLTTFRKMALRDGSPLEIRLGATGLAQLQPALQRLLAPSGFPDLDILFRLLTQTTDDGGIQRHFFGIHRGNLAAFLKYDASRRVPYVGSLGYVYVDEAARGLGIAQHLCQAAIDDFADRQGRAMFLCTGNPAARRIYQRLGFRTFNDHILRWVVADDDAAFDADYFAGRTLETLRDLTWADWAMAAVLYAQPTPLHIRDYVLQLHSGPGIEIDRFQSVIPPLMRAREQGAGGATVAQDTRGHLVGIATLAQLPGKWLADFLVHPSSQAAAAPLLRSLAAQAQAHGPRALTFKIAAADASKLHALRAAGARTIGEALESTGPNRREPVVTLHLSCQ